MADKKEQSKRVKAVRAFNQGFSNFLSNVAKQRRRQLVFTRDVSRPLVGSGRGGRGRGRPRGSYDKRYAAYGGVYGYRKILAAKLREQRLQSLRENAITPQQQAFLNQIEQRRMQQMQDPENQTIPDTRGKFNFGSYDLEIDDASNLVP